LADRLDPSENPAAGKRAAGHDGSQLPEKLAARLNDLIRPGQRLLLAYSGGLDSTVLLHLLSALGSGLGFELQAMHVHHGLSPNADDWARFCERTCERHGIPIRVVRVSVVTDCGSGIEAAARHARYQALFEADADLIVLAHHQDDQAETLLLQLLRGAGVRGLSAMPMLDRERRLLRPLLDVSRTELGRYAERHGLEWIEDESNQDRRYDRNFLRHALMPLLEERFQGVGKVLARTAGIMAESAGLLDELAEIDLAGSGLTSQDVGRSLPLACLRRLSAPRARNLFRWWLASQKREMPGSAHLADMMRQLLHAREDAAVSIRVDGTARIRRYRDAVHIDDSGDCRPFSLHWSGQRELELPDGSCLVFETCVGKGIARRHLQAGSIRIVNRQGGERFRPDTRRPTRTLKHLLQEAGMPPWERSRLPLVYLDDVLAAVPGIGVAAGLQAGADEEGLSVTWRNG
jgi:tRNA(Ile)-lysidine synthase